jgi:HPt (histidine-containing phosphotransfer) domain-containing protein
MTHRARDIIGDAPVIDAVAFERIRRIGGDRLLRQMIEAFLENGAQRVRTALDAPDAADAAQAAHALKSSAGNLGLVRVMRLAEAMEARAANGDERGCLALRPALAAAFDEARAALVRERERSEG